MHTMRILLRIGKWVACILGGSCAVSFLMVLSAALYFEKRDPDGLLPFLETWSGAAQCLGGPFDPQRFDPRKVRFDDPKKRWKQAFQEGW